MINKRVQKAYINGWTISNWYATGIFSIQMGSKLFIMTSVRPSSSRFPSLFFAYTTTIGSLCIKIIVILHFCTIIWNTEELSQLIDFPTSSNLEWRGWLSFECTPKEDNPQPLFSTILKRSESHSCNLCIINGKTSTE